MLVSEMLISVSGMVMPGEPDNITRICVGKDDLMCAIHTFGMNNLIRIN